LYFDPADYTIAGRAQRLRLRAQVYTDNVAPGVTLTAGLYQIVSISGSTVVIGGPITGSAVAFATPAADTLNQANSGDFAPPSVGHYLIGLAQSGTPADQFHFSAQLQTHWV
jgi:hypothetical protein